MTTLASSSSKEHFKAKAVCYNCLLSRRYLWSHWSQPLPRRGPTEGKAVMWQLGSRRPRRSILAQHKELCGNSIDWKWAGLPSEGLSTSSQEACRWRRAALWAEISQNGTSRKGAVRGKVTVPPFLPPSETSPWTQSAFLDPSPCVCA